MIILLHRDKTILDEGWKVLGKVCYHTKAICDVLFISPSSSSSDVPFKKQVVPRLISLAEDRVSFASLNFLSDMMKNVVESFSFLFVPSHNVTTANCGIRSDGIVEGVSWFGDYFYQANFPNCSSNVNDLSSHQQQERRSAFDC